MALPRVTVWPDYLCFDAASSWTSSSRRTSCSHWWRGCAPQRTATCPRCLTHRRPSPPPPNASPKGTPRSTPAGNCGSCRKKGSSSSCPETDAQHWRARLALYVFLVDSSSALLAFCWAQIAGYTHDWDKRGIHRKTHTASKICQKKPPHTTRKQNECRQKKT